MLYVQPVYVQSSGDAAYPTLRRVLVGFGEKVGFAPTLDGALDEVFGGNSGAKTDTGAGVSEKAAEAAQGGKGKDSTPSPSPSGTPAPRSSSLQEALDTANKAMQDSDKAMKDGDWTKYGEAQDRLKRAIDDAMAQDGATK